MKEGRLAGLDAHRFGYQGDFAEKDQETGWNAFDLRMYDGVVGRFTTIDPARQFFSPYVGMGNNPVMGVDPTGAVVVDDIHYISETDETWVYETDDDFDRLFIDGKPMGIMPKDIWKFMFDGVNYTPNGLDPATVGKNYLDYSYPGGNNPMTYPNIYGKRFPVYSVPPSKYSGIPRNRSR